MIPYVDTSTLLKREFDEPGADSSRARLRGLAASDDLVTSTSDQLARNSALGLAPRDERAFRWRSSAPESWPA